MRHYKEKDIESFSLLHHQLYQKASHSNYMEQFPKVKELTALEMSVLRILTENPKAMPKDLSENLQIHKSTLTNVIDRLEKRGYIYRVISSKDRRSFELMLTESGNQAQCEHLALEHGMYEKVLNALGSEEEIKEFLALAQKIAQNIEL